MPQFTPKIHVNCGMDEFGQSSGLAGSLAAGRATFFCPDLCQADRIEAMQNVLRYATMLAVVGVFLVLLAGFWNMMRGSNPNLSQKLMRWRVGLQFLAIIIAMMLVYLLRS
jgi:hypothetical protein